MAEPESLISIQGLQKTYRSGPFRSGFRALDDVSLEVGRGSVFGLLGPNGAGKTTLIKVLLGLVRGWRGEARLFGLRAGTTATRRRVGYLPEAHRLPGYLTGRQVLFLYGMYSGRDRRWLKQRVPRWLERVGMAKSADRKVREYSKGMQQRIGLAQALVHEPELIFLDEPTDGVDPLGRAEIRHIVSELRDEGRTVFVNSHLLMEVEQVCDRVVIMDRGRIVRSGTIGELTPHTGRVAIEVEAGGRDLQALVAGLGSGYQALDAGDVGARGPDGRSGFELSLGPSELDAAIDRLRAAGVGIRSITQRKLTLEDTFVDLVKGKRP